MLVYWYVEMHQRLKARVEAVVRLEEGVVDRLLEAVELHCVLAVAGVVARREALQSER